MGDYAQIIITALTVLGSAGIWQFLQARLKVKSEEKKSQIENSDGVQYRDDLKHRVRNLEAMLANSSDEKDELRNQVLALTEEVSALRIKVEFLAKENERLKNK